MKLTPKPCHFCGQEYQPKAVTQLCCYKVGCRIKAREREKRLENERRHQRNERHRQREDRQQEQRELGLLIEGKTGGRPCLKCGKIVPYGRHLCAVCKKSNEEYFEGVW